MLVSVHVWYSDRKIDTKWMQCCKMSRVREVTLPSTLWRHIGVDSCVLMHLN